MALRVAIRTLSGSTWAPRSFRGSLNFFVWPWNMTLTTMGVSSVTGVEVVAAMMGAQGWGAVKCTERWTERPRCAGHRCKRAERMQHVGGAVVVMAVVDVDVDVEEAEREVDGVAEAEMEVEQVRRRSWTGRVMGSCLGWGQC